MKIALIAAVALNRTIGRAGKLPWHIPEDLKRFKRLTTGHPILMGRKTFEALGSPLPHRRNVVVTSHPLEGVESYSSLPAALQALEQEDLVFVIGGGEVFRQLLDRADVLYLTIIHRDVEGDAFFPPYEHLIGRVFKATSKEDHAGYSFIDYDRIPAATTA